MSVWTVHILVDHPACKPSVHSPPNGANDSIHATYRSASSDGEDAVRFIRHLLQDNQDIKAWGSETYGLGPSGVPV